LNLLLIFYYMFVRNIYILLTDENQPRQANPGLRGNAAGGNTPHG
jgi:hypothetical protein